MSLQQLQQTFPDHLIQLAIDVCRSCLEDDDQQYFYVGNVEEFMPHPWVLASVIVAVQESYKNGYSDAFAKYGK